MRRDLPGHMLAVLSVARNLAVVEVLQGSRAWAEVLPLLDDVIERAHAENVSIGVSPILRPQVIDL